MVKHTDGRWEASVTQEFGCEVKANGEDIAWVLSNKPEDAHLMAAAHELLEALEDLVRINEQHNAAIQSVTGKPAGWKDDYLNQARAAIAKARGEA